MKLHAKESIFCARKGNAPSASQMIAKVRKDKAEKRRRRFHDIDADGLLRAKQILDAKQVPVDRVVRPDCSLFQRAKDWLRRTIAR